MVDGVTKGICIERVSSESTVHEKSLLRPLTSHENFTGKKALFESSLFFKALKRSDIATCNGINVET